MKTKNPTIAVILALLFPGLGHLYIGNKKKALKAFGLVVLVIVINFIVLVALSIIVPLNDSFVSDMIYSLGWLPSCIAYGWQLRDVYFLSKNDIIQLWHF